MQLNSFSNKTRTFTICLLFLMLAVSCRHKEGAFVISSKLGILEEKKIVINDIESNLTFINDTEALVLTNAGEMVLYNIYTGKEIGYFFPDTSNNTQLISFLNSRFLSKGELISIKSAFEGREDGFHIPTATIHTCFKGGEYIFAPYYLRVPYHKNMLINGNTSQALILDSHLMMFVLNKKLEPIRKLFGTDTVRSCFNFGFNLLRDTFYTSNLTATSEPKLPVFSKYIISNNELTFSGTSKIEFSKKAYLGQAATFVRTSFSEHPFTKKMLFCDTKRIVETESEKIITDAIFPDDDTTSFIMQFKYSSKNPNELYILLDRLDTSWTHHYSIEKYDVSSHEFISNYTLGTNDSIKAFSFLNNNVITLELQGENLIYKKYEITY